MGATNCPETPRQKMIGMMYLVLTAMLALNVSKEIINAFVTVGDAMQQTNENFDKKINDTYAMFETAYKGNPEKIAENYEKAKNVREMTSTLIDFIDQTKYELIATVEKKIKIDKESQNATPELAKELLDTKGIDGIKMKDEYSITTRYFCGGSADGVGAKATELKNKINEYRQQLEKILGKDASLVKLGLETNGDYHEVGDAKKKLTWESYNFFHTIAIADVVILNRIKTEVLNAEFDVVNHLYRSVSADDYKFSTVIAKVIPNSRYVLQGNYYEAEAIVAAYDEKASLEAVINGHRSSSNNGIISIKIPAGSLGAQTVKGTLYVKKESGEEPYEFQESYFVIPPTAVVSLTKMDVFYVGVDNPVSVNVPMVDSRDISISFEEVSGAGKVKGTISPDPDAKGAGDFIVKVPGQGKAVMNIHAKVDNRLQLVGKKEYRCKNIPTPSIEIGNMRGGGAISKEELIAAGGFRVRIPDFDFQIPAIKVNSFMLEGRDSKGDYFSETATGNRFNPSMLEFLKKSRTGQRVSIVDVRVVTPDNKQHTLSATLIIR